MNNDDFAPIKESWVGPGVPVDKELLESIERVRPIMLELFGDVLEYSERQKNHNPPPLFWNKD